MKTLLLAFLIGVAAVSVGVAQQTAFDRLAPEVFDVVPPSGRVSGRPGQMSVSLTSCRSFPLTEVRRRIVDLAAQEWAYFGFTIVDQTRVDPVERGTSRSRRRWRRLSPAESARVAGSIAGYWTATPQGTWILDEQNSIWSGPRGSGARWRYPWSAAFVSWVMCEGGLGKTNQFQRAVAHHVYIDQAIRAQASGSSSSAFAAYDVGQTKVTPGDLLCSARRPAYRSLADRRRQLGVGARTHCDIVVKVDDARHRILAIGGNVRGSVSLKLLPGVLDGDQVLQPLGGTRPLFAHLKLQAEPIADDALDRTPTVRALGCTDGVALPAQLAATHVVRTTARRC